MVASGNGGRNDDNCNYDGYANSMYTITIGKVDQHFGLRLSEYLPVHSMYVVFCKIDHCIHIH